MSNEHFKDLAVIFNAMVKGQKEKKMGNFNVISHYLRELDDGKINASPHFFLKNTIKNQEIIRFN